MNEIQETPQEQTPAETGSTQYFSPVEEAPQEQEVQNQETEVVEPVEEPTQESVESTDDEDDDKKPGKGFEKRIERFNRRIAEKEAEIEHWRKAALAGNQQAPIQAPVQMPLEKPTLATFNGDVEAYTDALTDWKLQQKELLSHQQKIAQTYAEREANVKKAHADYDEVIADFKEKYKYVKAPEINQYLAESDNGPAMFYYIANNTAEVDRILKLSPLHRLAELGKLEARLSAPAAKVAPKVSAAPKPASPEKGSAPVTKNINDPNLSQREYREMRMANRKRY